MFHKMNKQKKRLTKKIKAGSLPRKQNRNISQTHKTVKNSLKMWQQVDLQNLQNSICPTIIIVILLLVYA